MNCGNWAINKPAVPWRKLAAYGVFIGAGQFGMLYLALDGRIAPGLASLLIQVQVFFTIGLAMAADGERLTRWQVLALGWLQPLAQLLRPQQRALRLG